MPSFDCLYVIDERKNNFFDRNFPGRGGGGSKNWFLLRTMNTDFGKKFQKQFFRSILVGNFMAKQMDQTADLYLSLKKSYSLYFPKFCEKISLFLVLCLAKSNISKKNKHRRTKTMRSKISESESSYPMEATKITWGNRSWSEDHLR